MAQRFVVWRVPDKFFPGGKKKNPLWTDLSPESLVETSPELADALQGGRIVSHSVTGGAMSDLIVTFVVEYDDRLVGV